ncbi:MAG: hypothetical protein DMF53_28660 [Acidobacteria bacterium]|nr:MAG: hypothetical protein DMF53_28660 [Acidobacteriota bacterium]
MRDLLGRELRANPAYELVLWDRLAPEERRALDRLPHDPDFYGILRPRSTEGASSALGVKAVDRDTALLFLTLREPGPLPSYVRTTLGEATGRTVARLIADGVLEVEKDGAFVWGPAALQVKGMLPKGGRLAELSLAALRYGQALAIDDPLRLSFRLYGYNRRPLTPRWRQLLPGPEAVQAHLGIGPGGAHRKLLDRTWRPSSPSEAWLSWRSRAAEPAADPGGVTWKLYVSPAPEALAEGFGAILEALAAARAGQFKIGSGAAGLLRPDKIVAYFPTFERLEGAARAVESRLAGVAAQGVPFTSEIAGDGLLSWGMDPPVTERDPWGGRESWRLWLTHRLARALIAARGAGEEVEPWRYAVERLCLEGIDPSSWTPAASQWSGRR